MPNVLTDPPFALLSQPKPTTDNPNLYAVLVGPLPQAHLPAYVQNNWLLALLEPLSFHANVLSWKTETLTTATATFRVTPSTSTWPPIAAARYDAVRNEEPDAYDELSEHVAALLGINNDYTSPTTPEHRRHIEIMNLILDTVTAICNSRFDASLATRLAQAVFKLGNPIDKPDPFYDKEAGTDPIDVHIDLFLSLYTHPYRATSDLTRIAEQTPFTFVAAYNALCAAHALAQSSELLANIPGLHSDLTGATYHATANLINSLIAITAKPTPDHTDTSYLAEKFSNLRAAVDYSTSRLKATQETKSP